MMYFCLLLGTVFASASADNSVSLAQILGMISRRLQRELDDSPERFQEVDLSERISHSDGNYLSNQTFDSESNFSSDPRSVEQKDVVVQVHAPVSKEKHVNPGDDPVDVVARIEQHETPRENDEIFLPPKPFGSPTSSNKRSPLGQEEEAVFGEDLPVVVQVPAVDQPGENAEIGSIQRVHENESVGALDEDVDENVAGGNVILPPALPINKGLDENLEILRALSGRV